MNRTSILRILPLSLCIAFAVRVVSAQEFDYPPARKGDVRDNYHGTMVGDPYRWMEDEGSEELVTWIEAQNTLTFGYLSSIQGREEIRSRLEELWKYTRYGVPQRWGDYYYFLKNDGLQNQSVLYRTRELGSEAEVVLDPNGFSEDGTIALSGRTYSKDGSYLAYGLSTSGSDWQEIRIMDLRSGKVLDDVLQWSKFAGIAWAHDNSGFYYNRFPDPSTVPKGEESYNVKVYWHSVGTPQSDDRVVYEEPERRELGFFPMISDDGTYLILYVWRGTDRENRIYYREEGKSKTFVHLLDAADANYTPIENVGSTFYFLTNLDAPRGRVIAIDVNRPEKEHWKEIIPQSDEIISSVQMVNENLIVTSLKDVHHRVRMFDLEGTFRNDVPLPSLGTVSDIEGKRHSEELYFSFTSFLSPSSVYRLDSSTMEISEVFPGGLRFDASLYETKQVFLESKDETRIPMFLTHRRDIALDGGNPVLLYGYGGFNISLLPSFSPDRLLWLEKGGVFAQVNLRGGGEYGEEWHRAGMLNRKQNVFDDFIGAAEWLIQNNYTNPSRLAIHGRSNGGLLVAACMLQRPDLFGAVSCGVPVADMLRYHKFTVGRYWVGEYGNAEENAEHFNFLYEYSPLHNVEPGESYPPTIITTADHDDRVVPAHSMKFAATLQALNQGSHPILLRIETKAGHGGGKPISKRIEEQADVFAFILHQFGMMD